MALFNKALITDGDLKQSEAEEMVDRINERFDLTLHTSDSITEGTTKLFLTDAERSKLSGVESNATADQTGAEIKSLYEAEADTNAYTDAEKSKLSGIEDNATADQTDSEIEIAYNNQVSIVDQVTAEAGVSTTVYRWTPQRVAQAIESLAGDMLKSTYDPTNIAGDAFDMDNMVDGSTKVAMLATERIKLSGIETGATADQTGAEIKSLYEAEPNAYNDTKDAKLSAIEENATADQTASEIESILDTYYGNTDWRTQVSDYVDLNSNQSIAGNKLFTGQANVQAHSAAFAASANFDLNNGNVQEMTLTGNLTSLAVSNKVNGGTYIIYLIQDATGNRTIPTPDSSFGTKTANSADFKTTANAVNIITINVGVSGVTYYTIETT